MLDILEINWEQVCPILNTIEWGASLLIGSAGLSVLDYETDEPLIRVSGSEELVNDLMITLHYDEGLVQNHDRFTQEF